LDSTENEAQRRGISSNVMQYQRARQDLQEIAKIKGASQNTISRSYAPMPSSVAPRSQALDSISSDGLARQESAKTEVTFGDIHSNVTPREKSATHVQDFDSFASAAADAGARDGASVSLGNASLGASAAVPVFSATAPPPVTTRVTRSGWTPWQAEDGLHLFGWRELSDGTVIGLELRLDAIKSRLGEVFPAAPEPGEAYALRDTAGRAWHAVGAGDLPLAVEVPLAAASLPGWAVVGQMAEAIYGSSSDGGFFKVGAALVALLVFAILAAGGLLVRQARMSEQEAMLKTSFVANVSHELKTPLTTIRLYADLLAQGRVRDEAKRVAYLETIGHETQRLGRLVGNVLDFSRLEQGKKKYERVEFDLAAELRRLVEVHGPRLADAGLVASVDSPESLPVVTDRDAVEQIVLNLLENACKYAADGGEVLLSVKKTESGTRVIVADRGPGVPEGQSERIFEKFHRVDDRLTAEKGGAGLGLSIARQLARGLGGDLVCRAREGGGAEFTLTIT
jgi:signal transduction histidine kinase